MLELPTPGSGCQNGPDDAGGMGAGLHMGSDWICMARMVWARADSQGRCGRRSRSLQANMRALFYLSRVAIQLNLVTILLIIFDDCDWKGDVVQEDDVRSYLI